MHLALACKRSLKHEPTDLVLPLKLCRPLLELHLGEEWLHVRDLDVGVVQVQRGEVDLREGGDGGGGEGRGKGERGGKERGEGEGKERGEGERGEGRERGEGERGGREGKERGEGEREREQRRANKNKYIIHVTQNRVHI